MRTISSTFVNVVLGIIILLAATTTLFVVAINAQSLNSAINDELIKRETSLANIVTVIENVEKDRCAKLTTWSSSTNDCDVPSCGNVFPESNQFKCIKYLGNDENTCGSNCEGLIRSENKSTVIFAPGTSNENKNVQGFLAIGKEVEEAQYIERSSGRSMHWMGYGSVFGASRWYPGSPRNRGSSCSAYDPRLRSWYIAGSSGPKDVILVLDTSFSMVNAPCSSCKTRLQLMKEATSKLLDTLNFNDYFAIVSFADTGKIVTASGATTLLQATAANKNTAKGLIDDLVAVGGTDFSAGFQKAFSIFSGSTESTSGCSRIILHLTDGDTTTSDKAVVLSNIDSYQSTISSNKATIQTFTFTSDAATEYPKKIACANGGIHTHINDGANLLDAMASYYKFLALGLVATEESARPRYVEVYEDAFGLGAVTTVSRPVYDRSGAYPVFVGVAEVDIPLNVLTALGTRAEVDYALTYRGKTCPTYNVTDCQLQLLRDEVGSACDSPAPSVEDCEPFISSADNCTAGVSGGINEMLCDPLRFDRMVAQNGVKPYDEIVCCEECNLSIGAIIGIVAGSLVGVCIIGGVVYLIFFKGSAAAAAGAAAGASTAGGGSASVASGVGGAGSHISGVPAVGADSEMAAVHHHFDKSNYPAPSTSPTTTAPAPHVPQQQYPQYHNNNQSHNLGHSHNFGHHQTSQNLNNTSHFYPGYAAGGGSNAAPPIYGQPVNAPNYAFGQPPPAGYGGGTGAAAPGGASYPGAGQYY